MNIGIIVALIVIGLGIDIAFISSEYAGKMTLATVLKGLASLMFVLLGCYFYLNVKTSVGLLILVGLFLGMVGDILLNMRNLFEGGLSNKIFALGILAFLSGHFLYIASLIKEAFLSNGSINMILIAIVITAVLSILAIPPLMKRIVAPSKGLKIFGYVYLVVVIAMFSFAASLMIQTGVWKFTTIYTIGALFFVVSDFIMIYYSFGKKIKPLRAINLLTYYIGQILISFCIMVLS